MSLRRTFIAGMTVGMIAISFAARADTIQITSGTVQTDPTFFSPTYDLAGSDLRITGGTSDTGGRSFCNPCTAGAVPIAFGWGGDSWGRGSLTFGSTTVPTAWFGGDFHVTGTAIVPASGSGTFDVTFPFTVMPGSNVIAFATAQRNTQPFFSTDLTGSGLATLTLHTDPGGGLFDAAAFRLDFSAQPSPTPEPASLLLLGTGLIGAVVRRRFAL